MLTWKTRTAVVLCGMTLVLAGAPAPSHAIFDWLCPWAKKDQTVSTTYIPPYSGRPVVAAPAGVVAPIVTGVPSVAAGYPLAGVPTTCSYVPQTCYRTVYGPAPVTSCLPVRSYDPCSGCPVVTYRPVTNWTRRAMLQPYTTYRIVYTHPSCPTAGCAGACGYTPTTCGYAPATCGYASAVSGCASGTCGFTGGIAAPTCSSCAPSLPPSTQISPVPMSAAPAPGLPYLGTTAYGPAPTASWPATPATGPSATGSVPPASQPATSTAPTSSPTSSQAASRGGTMPSGPAPGSQGVWPGASVGQPVRSVPDNSKSATLPWPETRQNPAPQPNSPRPSPLAPVLNAPNNDQPPLRSLRQASYSPSMVPPSGGTPRVTFRLGPDGWEPAR